MPIMDRDLTRIARAATTAITGLVAAGLAPAPAQAGQVTARPATDSVCHLGDCSATVARLRFDAEPGERNAVTIAREGDVYTVRDAGAAIKAGTGCEQVDAGTVRCGLPGAHIAAALGDGDDALDAPPDAGVTADGGPGADRLTGGGEGDQLVGGDGADVLLGGEGDDTMWGDDASSIDPAIDDDVLDGGPGRDGTAYTGRSAPVAADLRAGVAGQAGEHDTLAGVEDVAGGRGADVLTGDDGRNRLDGGAGDDVLRGAGGADMLSGAEGVDRMDAGAGADRVDGEDPLHPGDCGDGRDVIEALGSSDGDRPGLVPPDCERIALGYDRGSGPTIGARPLGRTARALRFAFTCPEGSTCDVVARVTTLGRHRVVLARAALAARQARRRAPHPGRAPPARAVLPAPAHRRRRRLRGGLDRPQARRRLRSGPAPLVREAARTMSTRPLGVAASCAAAWLAAAGTAAAATVERGQRVDPAGVPYSSFYIDFAAAPGEANDLVTGGSGDDVLTGAAGRNVLSGGPGKDTLRGLDGPDDLYGDGSEDRLYGGVGNDELSGDTYGSAIAADLRDGGRGHDVLDLAVEDDESESIGGPSSNASPDGLPDTARCGRGRDTVRHPDAGDTLRRCEAQTLGDEFSFGRRYLRPHRAVSIASPETADTVAARVSR